MGTDPCDGSGGSETRRDEAFVGEPVMDRPSENMGAGRIGMDADRLGE
jgi:hypothetical protein